MEEAKNLGHTWNEFIAMIWNINVQKANVELNKEEGLEQDGNRTIFEQTCHCKPKMEQMKITAWNQCS